MTDDVTPIRPSELARSFDGATRIARNALLGEQPITVEPGETVHNATWHDGWRHGWYDCSIDSEVVRSEAYKQGKAQGMRAGMEVGPTWLNLAVVSTFTFICGFLVAIGYWGG